MNKLSLKQRAQILHMLVEGNSLRATARMADVSRNTVDKLLRDVGAACLIYQDECLRNLPCKHIQCDEIWSFVYSKQKNVPKELEDHFGVGDVWTWVSICADTKIVPCWHADNRGADAAKSFMGDLAGRLANRVQLTTDGHRVYVDAVEDAFGGDIDYAMLVKIYGSDKNQEKRYSPADYEGAKKIKVNGSPERSQISTSYIERQNLTMRMSMRRFTRLTNGFSKKLENHMHAISLHYMYYNFCRIHKSLGVTPAMEAGLTDTLHDIEWIVQIADSMEPAPKKRGQYKKRISN
ncbi:MAG TPA: DDE domain-containing protein [Phycisphaerales bacterium]|nr:DDE domain-containing protein [Phycisphaerales bacterium]